MRALVVYESMFGNTHAVAENIADGVRTVADTVVVSVQDATAEMISTTDLLVVGGPTHAHGMSRPTSRKGAADIAAKDDDLELEPEALGDGLREWFDTLRDDAGSGRRAAAFDTRVHATTLLTGQASKGIRRRLRKHGFEVVIDVESFFVDTSNHLEPGEADRATAWGRAVAQAAQPAG